MNDHLTAPGVRAGGDTSKDLSVRDVLRILRKRRFTILIATLVCVALAVLAIFVVTTRYESVASIEVNQSATDLTGFGNLAAGMMSGDATDVYTVTLETEASVLGSDTTILQVVKDLNLEQVDPDYQTTIHWWTSSDKRAEVGKPLEDAPIRRAAILKRFNKNLNIKAVPGTRVMEIHYQDQDPVMAAKIANHLVDVFLKEYVQSRYSATTQVSDWLSRQLDELKSDVNASESKLSDFQREHGLTVSIVPTTQGTASTVADTNSNVIMQRYEQLSKQLTDAQAARMNAQAVYDLTKSGDPEVVSTLTAVGIATPQISSSAAVVERLRSTEADLKANLALLKNKYDINYPRVKDAQHQLDDLQGTIRSEVDKIRQRAANDLAQAQKTEASLQTSLESQKAAAAKLNDASLQFSILSQEAQSEAGLYQDLLLKLKEASVLAGLQSTNIDVTDKARPSAEPAQPNIPIYLAVGLFAGLMSGCGLAFLREELDNSILTPAQVEETTTVPVLCAIPDLRTVGKRSRYGIYGRGGGDKNLTLQKQIDVSQDPKSVFAEAYRSLRTSVLLASVDKPPQVIIVTSGLPGEGKSVTSHNFASILAQNGSRVLLVHADMRRPGVVRSTTTASAPGLSALLSGTTQSVLPSPDPMQPNLYVVGPGVHPPYPAELLGSNRAAQLIAEWRKQYDFIVFDTPPLLLVSDAVILAKHADAVILVVRYARSTKQALRASVKILDHARIPTTGIVINAMDTSATEYESYYGYDYADYGTYGETVGAGKEEGK